MTNCKTCGKVEKNDGRKYTRNFCDSCVSDKEIGVSKIIEMVFLKGYGKVEKSRLREMDRRVILPYKHPESGCYYLGRRNERGGISEKHPTY